MARSPRSPALAALLALLALVAASAASAVPSRAAEENFLQTYRKRFTREAYLSDKEEVLRGLVATKDLAAREALLWCAQRTREHLEAEQKESDKIQTKVVPLQLEVEEEFRKFREAEAKRGNPDPKGIPKSRATDALQAARAELWEVERRIAVCRAVHGAALRAQGELLDALPPADQEKARTDLAKEVAQAKEWSARAERYESLGSAKADWALRMLQDFARSEADPRALAAALDGLGGRDPKHVVPLLTAKLDDPRWLVRVAALGALERTPSRETIDAVLARFAKEEGRLRDDCLRILVALTGAADVVATPESWTQWWAMKRESWTGPPPPPAPLDPEKAYEGVKKDDSKRTGFFGLEVKSRRLAYVIDVSGSMNEPVEKGGKETRAQRAKEELVRAIRGLEDGAWFNVVLFSGDVRPWKDAMQEAGPESRKAAVAFVEAAIVVGGTASYDALAYAFTLGDVGKGKARGADPTGDAKLDTIVFLSDGKPSVGRVVEPDEIRTAVREWFRARRITVHAISFGRDADLKFMEGLAKDTGGTLVVR